MSNKQFRRCFWILILWLLCHHPSTFSQTNSSQAGQTSSSTVTVVALTDRVRITAPSSIVQMRVELYDANVKLWESEVRGNVFDWDLQNGKVERLPTGEYVCVVTIKNVSGRVIQKIGGIQVGEKDVRVGMVEVGQLSLPQSQAIGPIEADAAWTVLTEGQDQTTTIIAHDGTDGQIIRGRGAFSFRLGDFYFGKDQEQMRLTEEGNLGIGTARPQFKLDVVGAIRARHGFVFGDGSTLNVNESGVLTRTASDGTVTPNVVGTGTQNRLVKWTDNSGTLGDSGITETTGGNLGIGTSTPDSLLNVQGAIPSLLGKMAVIRTTGANNGFGLQLDATGSGNNNLGLAVNGQPRASFAFDNARQFLGFVNLAYSANDFSLRINNNGSLTYHDGLSSAELFRITNSGNVGIGTTAPQNKLQVAGAIQVTGPRTGSPSGNALTLSSESTFDTLQSFANRPLALNALGNNVGIGTTSPSARFHVFGPSNDTADPIAILDSSGTTIPLSFRTSGTERARIRSDNNGNLAISTVNGPSKNILFRAGDDTSTDMFIQSSTGNIGVGTLSPSARLTVSGAGAFDATGAARFDLTNTTANTTFLQHVTDSGNWQLAEGENTRILVSGGNVGIGTLVPQNRLHLVQSFSPAAYVARFESLSAVLDLKRLIPFSVNGQNIFINFRDSNDNRVGSIQENGSGGIDLHSGSADYAEWLPRVNPSERIQPGDIVGLFGGRITKNTGGTTKVMVVSTGPIILGNDPGEKKQSEYEKVAFMGQVMVRVRGTVKAGDFIIPSGLNDGTGVAVSADHVTSEQFQQVVGEAWESSDDPGLKSVRTAVGLIQRDPTMTRLIETNRKQAAQIKALNVRLTTMESTMKQVLSSHTRRRLLLTRR